MVTTIDVAGQQIGPGYPCFVIAEAGVNHNGDLNSAYRLVDTAILAGADAVKFQTFKAAALASPNAPKADYQKHGTDSAESQYEMLRRLELSTQDHEALFRYCQRRGILFLSSPFDEESADFLETLGVAAFKIPSGEVTNPLFLAHVARKGKPMIISTGMAYLGEIETAIRTVKQEGNNNLILLHCVSNYPADPVNVNLRAMQTMRTAFKTLVGYSDHTMGIEVALAAVAMGACVIEKHFTLDRGLPGPDHRASLEPDELATLIEGIRKIELALGHGRKEPAASELNTAAVARKSLVAAQDIVAGTVLTESLLAIKRPGTGLPPVLRPSLVGRVAAQDIAAGTLLSLEMFR